MKLNDLSSYTHIVPVLDNSVCIQICIRYMYLQILFYHMYEFVMMLVLI